MNGGRDPDANRAAIVYDHVAVGGQPILHAARSEPLEDVDSGWQFLRGGTDHATNAKIWALREVLSLEPTLAGLVDLPAGTQLNRQASRQALRVWVRETELH